MKMKYIAKYENGYHGCEDVHFIIADNEYQVVAFMQEGIYDYASNYEWVARNNWTGNEDEDEDGNEVSEDDWYDSADYEDYLNDCYFDIWEATEDDIENWSIKKDDWEDIT